MRSGAIGGSASWYISTMVPGLHPFEELESALARIAITPVGGTAEAMASERRGISRGVRRFLPDDGQLVLVIDQFEELFMLCADPHERELFIAGLIEALTEPRSRLRVVCTLRADFYDRPLRHPELAKLVEGSTVAVTPLAADELEAAITEPAHRAGVEFEPGLVAHIVADVVDQPGALPLLQYALTELFDRQEQGVLTLAAYEAFGGLTGALARRGEDLYTTESEREREATRRLFTRLVSLGEATEDTRRRVRRSELGGDADTQAMIDRFGEARLLSFDRDPTTREQTVEVAHEALLREWPRLRAWLDDDRDGLRLQRHITTSASAWEARARDDSELYHGARLETATHWVDEHPGELNDTERAFIDASRDQHRSIEAARVRSARRLRRAVVAMAAIAIIALVAGGIAWRQQRAATSSRRAAAAAAREANDQRDAATASATDAEQQRLISDQQRLLAQAASRDADTQRESAVATAYAAETARMAAIAPRLAKSDPTLGMLLAAEADQRGRDPATLGALQDVLAADTTLGYIRPGPANYIVQQVGFDAAGDIVTFGGIPAGNTYDEQIIIWDAHTHVKIRSIPNPRTSIPQGPEVVSISGNEAAWIDTNNDVWTADLTTGEIMPQGGAADAVGLAIDAVSHQLVVVTSTGEVQAFDDGQNSPRWTAGGDLAVPGTKAYVVFNQAGTKVYISRTLGVRVFEMTSGNEFPGVSYPTGGAPQYIAPLASDDSKVIIGSPDKAVLANLNDGTTTEVPPAVKSSDSYNFIATGGDRYAAIDFNGSVTISDATNATLVGPIELNSGRTWAAAVSPDGRTMVVGGDIGAEIIALDASTLMRATLPIPSDFKHFVAISDRLTYASNTTTDPKDFQVHTGSYWDCEPQCAQST
ncbi:MAG: nSTAND1 domain-containing NTPase, partial [Ilumatobacteraceae bacterium]